jgi:DNA-binding winged helix-turn-helix (wHTH) protein
VFVFRKFGLDRIARALGRCLLYRFADCTFDVARRELRRGGLLRPLEPQVFELLRYLIENRERVVSRDDIFLAVWHGRIVTDTVLSTRLNAARAAIGDDGKTQRLIRTLPKQGIRFVGEIREEGRAPAFHLAEPSRRLALSLSDAPAIALLPVACLGEDRRAGMFASALGEEIAGALWRHDWLLVIAADRFAQARSARQLRQACDELSARYMLQASARPLATQSRIMVRLIEAQSGCHLWTHTYDVAGDEAAAGDIAAQIARHVPDVIFSAEALRGRLTPEQRRSAWGGIVAALSLMNTRDKAKVDAAERLLRQAIAHDPSCAPAHALLSFVATLRVHLGWRSRPRSEAAALAAAQRAIQADGDDAWSHVALGYATLQVCNRAEEAVEILRHALALNPALSMAHYLIALSSAYSGDIAAAFRHADIAEELHPHDLLARGNAGAYNIVRATTSFVAGQYHEGAGFARAALRTNPRQVPAYRQLVINAAFGGEMEQARGALDRLERMAPDVGRFIRESASVWRERQTYDKYREAFSVAGLK